LSCKKEKKNMTSYRNERNRKKLLVPVVALVVCAAAMIGLGYAALTSTVTNQANVVAGDGLEAKLLDEDGDLLAGTQFSAGAETIDFGTKQTDAGKTYYVLAMDDMKLGGATLFLRTIDSDVTAVNISYEVTFYEEDEEGVKVADATPYGMTVTHELREYGVASGTPFDTASVNEDGVEYEIELYATFTAADGLPVEPSLSYDITITVTPVTV